MCPHSRRRRPRCVRLSASDHQQSYTLPKMAEKWIDMMPNDGGMVVDIPSWVSWATLGECLATNVEQRLNAVFLHGIDALGEGWIYYLSFSPTFIGSI